MPREAASITPKIERYCAFWPYYLREHAKAETRHIHVAGTVAASLVIVAGVLRANPKLIGAAIVLGYAPAWFAHAFVERNRPATFRYPFWSLVSDFRMTALWLAGGLADAIAKADSASGEHGKSNVNG